MSIIEHTLPEQSEVSAATKHGDQPIVKKAVNCSICGSNADRWRGGFQCQSAPGHIADLNTGIFSDCTFPSK